MSRGFAFTVLVALYLFAAALAGMVALMWIAIAFLALILLIALCGGGTPRGTQMTGDPDEDY